MADPRSLLHDVLERIDAAVYHHEQLLQWSEPDSDGPIYPQQVERHRMARCAMEATSWMPGAEPTPAPPVTIRMEQATFTPTGPLTPPPGYTVLDEEHTFTREELVEAAAIAPPRPWWQRFARWPNVE